MSADLIQALIEAGTPAALIARVANELASANAKAEILETRRRNERERKAKSREVTGQDVTGRDGAEPPFLDKESFPQTPFKEIKPIPVCATPARKATRIPDGWAPTKPLSPNVKALTDQWPPGRYERELDGFRDYWSSRQRNAAMLDWDKGWWNRIRDQHDRIMREARNGQRLNGQQSASGYGRTVDAAMEFVREVEARDGSGFR